MSVLAADTGFTFADTFPIGLLFLGLAVFAAVGAMSHEHERAFSASLIYLGLGAAAAAVIQLLDIEWIEPVKNAEVLEHLAEVALIFALFSSGLKLDRSLRWREWGSVVRLLAIAMPLTIAGIALFASQVIGLSLGAAVLLGAVLAPTDPVLAGDIGVGPPGDEAEHEPNFALTAEAGANDGLAAPFVLLGIFITEKHGAGWLGEWLLADVLYAGLAGVAIGAAVGWGAAWSVHVLRDRELLAPAFDGYHAIATALVLYGVAEAAGGYGFLAVFAGGLAFRRYEHGHELNGRVHAGAEQVEKFMELGAILLLGSLLTGAGLTAPGWEGWLLAVVLLVVIRPAEHVHRADPLAGRGRRRPVVRRLVRGPRGGDALLRGDRRRRRRALRRRGGRPRVDRDRVRDRLDRRPRHHGRARAAAAVPEPARGRAHAATRSRAGDASRSLSRSSTACSTTGWWIGSSPTSSVSAISSSTPAIVSPPL